MPHDRRSGGGRRGGDKRHEAPNPPPPQDRRSKQRRAPQLTGTTADETRMFRERELAGHADAERRTKGRRRDDPAVQRPEVEPDRRHFLHKTVGGRRK